MTSYTPELAYALPTPNDPAVANAWGTILNTNFSLIDSAGAGLLSLSAAGSSNVVLTQTNGAADQERNSIFVFTGVLTGNIDVLYPNGKTKLFAVKNSTSGAFTLSLGVNNGSGSPAGSVAVISQGSVALFYSDGTNVFLVAGLGPSVSGAFTLTLTVTGSTNVTLPVSGNIPDITVSSSAPSGSGNLVGSIWVQK